MTLIAPASIVTAVCSNCRSMAGNDGARQNPTAKVPSQHDCAVIELRAVCGPASVLVSVAYEVVEKCRDLMAPVLGAKQCDALTKMVLTLEKQADLKGMRPLPGWEPPPFRSLRLRSRTQAAVKNSRRLDDMGILQIRLHALLSRDMDTISRPGVRPTPKNELSS